MYKIKRKPFIYAYKNYSQGAKALREGLNALLIQHRNSRFRGKWFKNVINWGCSDIPNEQVHKCNILNHPSAVNNAACKLRCFEILSEQGVSIPEYTISKETALQWARDGDLIVCRTKLRGHSGEGIILWEYVEGANIPDAKLYVKYIKKQDEFRVHVFKDKVLDIQQKKRKKDVPNEEVNWKVRNRGNGFIYAREGVVLPESVRSLACDSIRSLSLDFGAVDIIHNKKQDKYYVLEVNTAPGLYGTTLENYLAAFKEVV